MRPRFGFRHGAGLALLALVLVLAPQDGHAKDEASWADQAFLGLSVRDAPSGLVVGWVSPGPLGGTGFESKSGIQRGDNVVSLDGEKRDRLGFERYLGTKKPGEEIELVTRRSPKAGKGAVPKGGAGGTRRVTQVTLGSRDLWSGTVARGLQGRSIPDVAVGEIETRVLDAAAAGGARKGTDGVGGGLDALMAHLRKTQAKALDVNSLPAIVQAFRHPLRLDTIEAAIAARAAAAKDGGWAGIEALVRETLDLGDVDGMIREVMGKPKGELNAGEIGSLIRFAGQHLVDERANKDRAGAERLLRTLGKGIYIYDEHADTHVATIRRFGQKARGQLRLVLAMLRHAPAAWDALGASHAKDAPLDDVPPEVRALVPKGDVLWHGKNVFGDVVVVGGPGPNEYEMGRLGAVYDVGGDDVYRYGGHAPGGPLPMRLVVDLKGNDTHRATSAFDGPATGVFALSVLDDRAGNDRYAGEASFTVAAGLGGIGVLLDHAGNDTYENRGPKAGWAIGTGFWGAGLLIDRAGRDVYRGEKFCQGVGGPLGLGMILESGGRDLYVANGPAFPSAYGTPGVYVGMSQGFGFGVRGYAAGGLGAIYDFGGNDQYEAGEFSQAGGYYWGLGILHDAKGHDLYHGNRYGQAFAAHQALGVLIDDAGDDTYWSMTAASQAGTWDESIGLLLDRAGNDSYRCDGLGQGGASMQAIALLFDLGGNDRYSAAKGSTQGQGGSNTYHYDRTRVFSFSGLFDLGGGTDTYSGPGKNDETRRTGAHDAKRPARSSLYGVFVDR